MKVLFITHDYIEIKNNSCWCKNAIKSTIENFLVFGELYLLAGRPNPNKPAAQPITEELPFLPPNHVEYLYPTNLSIISHFKNEKRNKELMKKLFPQMDLIISYGPSGQVLEVAHNLRKPVLTIVIGCPWDSLRHHRRLLANILAPLSYFSARKVIKRSEFVHYVTADFLQNRYPTDGKSIGCSDVDIGEMNTGILNKRMKLRQERNGKIIKIVTTGSIDANYKGQEYVIKALVLLKKAGYTHFHYYLISGGKGEKLHQIAKSLQIEDQIHFLGRLNRNQVFETLDNADIYVQPSLTEGLPRSVIEAMSRALPCIGSNVGGIPELIEDKFLVPKKDEKVLANKIICLQDEKTYQEASTKNYYKAQSYTKQKLKEKTAEFYKEIRGFVENKANVIDHGL